MPFLGFIKFTWSPTLIFFVSAPSGKTACTCGTTVLDTIPPSGPIACTSCRILDTTAKYCGKSCVTILVIRPDDMSSNWFKSEKKAITLLHWRYPRSNKQEKKKSFFLFTWSPQNFLEGLSFVLCGVINHERNYSKLPPTEKRCKDPRKGVEKKNWAFKKTKKSNPGGTRKCVEWERGEKALQYTQREQKLDWLTYKAIMHESDIKRETGSIMWGSEGHANDSEEPYDLRSWKVAM